MLQEKIQVDIFGRRYELNIEGLTPMEASALASQVTEKMLEVQKTTRVVDTSRLAVLAALNFADELRRLGTKHSEFTQAVSERSQALKKILDETLKEP
ncbi:MAG: cell division protein ZapA [Elusimicrobia bacterium]|nr:cell division protein ZapA [Elusimicrobiota bacterium]